MISDIPNPADDLLGRRWVIRRSAEAHPSGTRITKAVVLAVSGEASSFRQDFVAEFDDSYTAEFIVNQHNHFLDTPRPKSFAEELTHVLNRWSKESPSNTPDHLLAAYVERALDAAHVLIGRRDAWYGVILAPGHEPEILVDAAIVEDSSS